MLDYAFAAFGITAALILVGAPSSSATSAYRQHFALMQAALDKGITSFPHGPRLAHLRVGVLAVVLGISLIGSGIAFRSLANSIELPPVGPQNPNPNPNRPGPRPQFGPGPNAPMNPANINPNFPDNPNPNNPANPANNPARLNTLRSPLIRNVSFNNPNPNPPQGPQGPPQGPNRGPGRGPNPQYGVNPPAQNQNPPNPQNPDNRRPPQGGPGPAMERWQRVQTQRTIGLVAICTGATLAPPGPRPHRLRPHRTPLLRRTHAASLIHSQKIIPIFPKPAPHNIELSIREQ